MTIYLIEYFTGDRWLPAQYIFYLNNYIAQTELKNIQSKNRVGKFRVAEYIFNKDM